MKVDMKTIAEHFERALDEALKMTFPTSDPIALGAPQPVLTNARNVNNNVRCD
jgi:hypothetical protein